VSHETIYQAIHALPRGELKKELLTCFRQDKPHRGRRSKVDEKHICNMASIHSRPGEIEGRLVPGHWEGDLIKGAANRSSVGTLVERTSGKVVSHPRSSNRTCPIKASGSPTGFTVRHTESKPTARGFGTVSNSPSPLDTAISGGACL
jgi:IS30 family transposase